VTQVAFCHDNHDHSLYKCIPPPTSPSACEYHFGRRTPPPAVSCPHCAEDAKILEDKIEQVAVSVGDLAFAIRAHDKKSTDKSHEFLMTALRELVREVRRG
jgi:hypothetical protein